MFTCSDYHGNAPMFFDTLEEADVYLNAFQSSSIDVCEICGGEAGVSKICIRRRLKTGENFDIVAGFDLTQKAEIAYLWKYLR